MKKIKTAEELAAHIWHVARVAGMTSKSGAAMSASPEKAITSWLECAAADLSKPLAIRFAEIFALDQRDKLRDQVTKLKAEVAEQKDTIKELKRKKTSDRS